MIGAETRRMEETMELPEEFLERMRLLLGEETDAFLAAGKKPRSYGLRVNTLKISVEEFLRLAPFHLRRIPWTDNGFYYEKEDEPARHPFYSAGLYYLQEPSAMAPASFLPVSPGEHVLDLCAAPGGKATALAAKLQGRGLLVANDLSASRAKALLKNLELFGVRNSFVTAAPPYRLAQQFQEEFDKILVDAPCSGEGMFRKDAANIRAWSMDKVEECVHTQREILLWAARMLRPGGLLLYSTCTFSPEENEGAVRFLLEQCPELELAKLPRQEGFVSGLSAGQLQRFEEDWAARKKERTAQNGEMTAGSAEENRSASGSTDFSGSAVRLFPHHLEGEGHFLALLRKKGTPVPHVPLSRGGRRKPAREEEKILREFLKDVTMPWQMEQMDVHGSQVYFVPEPPALCGTLPFLRSGLYLGELKKNRFEPSQSLAMALRREEYASSLNFDPQDERVRRYLGGETIEAADQQPARSGWQLVCVGGYPLGWGRLVGTTLKNKYHPGWRVS